MSLKRILDVDPLTGATETFEYDDDADKPVIHKTEDVTKHVDLTKKMATEWDGWTGPDKTRKLVARVPQAVCDLWLTKHGIDVFNPDHAEAVGRLLNSNEWQWLRVGGGTI